MLADLARQALPSGFAIRVVVIDDGSTDGTGHVARSSLARIGVTERAMVIRRDEPATTKGAALEAGLRAARDRWTSGFDAALVLDADARVHPAFVVELLAAAGPDAATARRRMLPVPWASRWDRWLARVQDDEQAVDLAIRRLRSALGGVGELRGDGMLLPLRDLDAVGGFPSQALCEDLELSNALAQLGRRPRLAVSPAVWEQPALEIDALIRQRLRWAEGAIRRDLRSVWPRLLDRRVPLPRRLDAAAYAGHTTLGVLIAGSCLLGVGRGRGSRLGAALAATVGAAAFAGATAALARYGEPGAGRPFVPRASRLPSSRLRGKELIWRAASVVAFGALWLPVTAVAWVRVLLSSASHRGPSRYEPTPKRADFSAPWDPSDSTP